jgi:hypothetical protein
MTSAPPVDCRYVRKVSAVVSAIARKRLIQSLSLAVVTLGLACGSESVAPGGPQASIDSFIASRGLIQPSPAKMRLQLHQPLVDFFDVRFGTPFLCYADGEPGPIQCQLGYATGLRYGARIGWIVFDYFQDPDSAEIARAPRFDLRASDAQLLSNEFADSVCARDWDLCHYGLPPYLVREPDTPHWRLVEVAQGLNTFINPGLADVLLAAPATGQDCEILRIIASLFAFQGDAYAVMRATAAARLTALAACVAA